MRGSSFLWGASTSPYQTEGNNIASDWWGFEGATAGLQYSGDALDGYHRYEEDMRLLVEAGFNAYRFGIEWARIEPRADHISRAALAHYRRVIETAHGLGLTPVVTLHHFTSPMWLEERGGLAGPDGLERFVRYVEAVAPILHDVEWIATINEPNIYALILQKFAQLRSGADEWLSPTLEAEESSSESKDPVIPDLHLAQRFAEIHRAAAAILRKQTGAKVGWTIANHAFTAAPGGEKRLEEIRSKSEDFFLEVSREDDFVGVQAYSSQEVDSNGVIPHAPHPDNTMTGVAFRPDALEIAVRHAWEVTGGVPIVVTENGIATSDDARRIQYVDSALDGLSAAIRDGISVQGYLHWSLLDNYEWGHWEPTFGLVAVNRESFERIPKPSLQWLGDQMHRFDPRDINGSETAR